MKYSLFTVSVPEMTLEEAAQKMKEYGYNGVDWRVTAIPTDPEILAEEPSYWRNNLCTVDIDKVDEIADEVGGIAQKYGLEVNALATYLESSDSLEKIEKCMIAAKKMGCSRIRVNARKYDETKGYTTLFSEDVAGFTEVQELAKKHGVKADFEMHMGTIVPSASAARRLASYFDPNYIGVIYDTGNVIYEGYEEYKNGIGDTWPVFRFGTYQKCKMDKKRGRRKREICS